MTIQIQNAVKKEALDIYGPKKIDFFSLDLKKPYTFLSGWVNRLVARSSSLTGQSRIYLEMSMLGTGKKSVEYPAPEKDVLGEFCHEMNIFSNTAWGLFGLEKLMGQNVSVALAGKEKSFMGFVPAFSFEPAGFRPFKYRDYLKVNKTLDSSQTKDLMLRGVVPGLYEQDLLALGQEILRESQMKDMGDIDPDGS